MIVKIILMVALLVEKAQAHANTPYCALNKLHTLCKYKTNIIGSNCPPGTKFRELSKTEKSIFVRKHNEYRSDVATGDRIKYFCPIGADIMELCWDHELQLLAEVWAKQCPNKSDEFRRVERFEVGQNIFYEVSTNDTYNIESIVETWNNEYKRMSREIFNGKTFNGCERFTQIVWSTTLYLGCAKQFWKQDNQTIQLTVCNYGPAGNVLGHPLYKRGKACTECPKFSSACTTERGHDGLCTIANKGLRRNAGLMVILIEVFAFMLRYFK